MTRIERYDDVYVLGLDYRVKNKISWQSAVGHILEKTAIPFKVHETKRVRSAGGDVDMALPLIIRLNDWKHIPFEETKPDIDLNSRASKTDILKRDGRRCCYCGHHATTVDHMKPESRCKKDKDPHDGWTWGNLVAACFDCNNWKDDRTPEEAGMEPLWLPYVVTDRFHGVQKEVWKILEAGGGYIPEEEYMVHVA